MNKKTLTTVLFFILLSCFFIPLAEWDSFEMSGMNFVLSSHTPDTKYILLVIPVSALFVLLKAIKGEKLRYLPFCISIFLFIICNSEPSDKNILQIMDYGFWITLIISLLLIFIKPEVRQY